MNTSTFLDLLNIKAKQDRVYERCDTFFVYCFHLYECVKFNEHNKLISNKIRQKNK
jgi:hypothetical protein